MSKKDILEINIIYDINCQYNINIFGPKLANKNKNICKMIINNKEYKIKGEYKVKSHNNNKLKIKLKEIDKVTNMSSLFERYSSLSSLSDISKWNTKNFKDINSIFIRFYSLGSLPDISKLNTNNVNNMREMLYKCPNIIISKIIKTKHHL